MSRAAIRYAKAVLETASEKNALKAVYDEMKAVTETIDQSQELETVLKSPVVSSQNKKEVLKEVFSSSSELTKNLIDVLVENKRVELLQSVAGNYIRLYNEKEGVVEAVVTTAVPLDSSLEEKVLAKVKELTKATNVTLHNSVDPAIIGGFVLRIGDTQYDASIANSFNKLKKEFNSSI